MRDELPSSFMRLLAYLGAVALPSVAAAQVSQLSKVMSAITPVHDAEWMEVERLFPAFVLSILEDAGRAMLSRGMPKAVGATPFWRQPRNTALEGGANRPEPRRTGR